ncbi:MAG: carbohydrate kinase family protein [Nocardioides sp.]
MPELAFGQAEQLVDGIELVVGGSASITAHGAARLGLGVALVAVVGDDALGGWLRERLSDAGVDASRVRATSAAGTGASVLLDRGGDRAILTHLGAIGLLSPDDLHGLPDLPARHVHVASYFLLPADVRAALPAQLARWRAAGATTSVDSNDDPSRRWDVDALFAVVDIALPNEAEERALAAAGAWEGFDGEVVVKQGPGGAAWRRGEDSLSVPAPPPERLVDTTGAGDSFNAAYLAARFAGLDARTALAWGVAGGTLSTRASGGTAAQGTRAEIEQLARRVVGDG